MPNILLVDDSATDRQLFSELLGAEPSFRVLTCEDGRAALESISAEQPDLVVTDMQMPEMDGLELVTRVREEFPHVPVVLITGAGSEALATKALRAGAAGYVPKSHSGEWLTETVRHVLTLARTRGVDERVHSAARVVHYEWELPNDESVVPGLLQLVRQRLEEFGSFDPVALLQVEVAVEHATLNAIYHGNLEVAEANGAASASRIQWAARRRSEAPYADRRVHVAMHATPTEAKFVVRDDGEGFDVKEVSSLGLSHSLRGEFGRGLFLMWAFMDKVMFDKTGNAATLVKRAPERTPKAVPQSESPRELPQTLGALRAADGRKSYDLNKKRMTVGRDASCDIVINSGAVSHHHCLLFLHEGWWFIRDLKSKNGIRINGRQHDQHLLPPACVLSIGPHEFHVDYQPHKLGAPGITPPVDPF